MQLDKNYKLNFLFFIIFGSAIISIAIFANVIDRSMIYSEKKILLNNQQPVPSHLATAMLLQESFSDIVLNIKSSVVGIQKPIGNTKYMSSDLKYLEPYPKQGIEIGTGFIVHPAGYILTSFQCVGSAKNVGIIYYNYGKKHLRAKTIAVDYNTDLVLLQIVERMNFTAAPLGVSSDMQMGDLVIAIGNPFGFSQSVTLGIVSSNNRELIVQGRHYPQLIQTDASINKGNSGGPMLNIRGEVIGVNCVIYAPENIFTGIGFAVPIDKARKFINRYI